MENMWCCFTGHLLDDQDLVDTLKKSKGISEEIYSRVGLSEDTEKKLNQARKGYLPVCCVSVLMLYARLSIIINQNDADEKNHPLFLIWEICKLIKY